MLGNMLNDLAEAIRRWTEKKPLSKAKSGSTWQSHFWQCGTSQAARDTKLRRPDGSVGMALSCHRWQTAGGSSNPCWSTRESQVRPAERQRAPTKKNSRHEALRMTQVDQSWVLFEQPAPWINHWKRGNWTKQWKMNAIENWRKTWQNRKATENCWGIFFWL